MGVANFLVIASPMHLLNGTDSRIGGYTFPPLHVHVLYDFAEQTSVYKTACNDARARQEQENW